MRSFLLLAALIVFPQLSLAQPQCLKGGFAYSEGASSCLPKVQGDRVEQYLFSCKNGGWVNSDQKCPEKYSDFCVAGPFSVPVGTILVIGSGPESLECILSGQWQRAGIKPPSPSDNFREADERLARSIQLFLSKENVGLNCSAQDCSGKIDDGTKSSIVEFVRKNFSKMTSDEKKRWGIDKQSQIESVIRSKSPAEIANLFAETFSVR
ncbi:hypothetical protein [Methylobacterium sp. WSM2598]|uniref:hypothetical protein n=1 Tax=Methylobacterium sp. WSM2598 TaxID=398261 RepID=UPI0012F6B464|nr:hypothetical protein [Methylobacterium sp. WSM2598]